MQRTLTNRRQAVLLSLVMVATGFVGVHPVRAQDPAPAASTDPYRVLVPTLEEKGDVRGNFAKKVAEAVAKSIGNLRTHTPVPSSEVKEALRKYKLKEEELDCIKERQLAVQINAELVMCGTVEPAAGGYNVTAQFIGAKTGETFELTPITASDPNQAAAQIFSQFEAYIKQLSLASFCSQYLGSQQWELALKNCNEALAVNPNSQTVRMLMGMAYYRSGMSADQGTVTDTAKLVLAMEQYKKVIDLNPVNQDALRQAGIIAARLGDAEASRKYFEQYMDLNPGDVGVRLAIASEAAKNGDPEGALRVVEAGLKADSNSVDLNTYAGHFAIQAATKGEDKTSSPFFAVAANYYKKVLALKDTATDTGILQNLILASQLAGNNDEAVTVGARAVQIRPNEASLWSAYARALLAANKNEEALRAIESGLAIDPKFKGLAAQRVTILLNQGRLDDAKKAVQEAVANGTLDADDASQAVFQEGSEKYRAQNYDAALDYFALAREIAVSSAKKGAANFWTGMVYYQRGIPVAKPQTAKAARAALPIFQRALEYLQAEGTSEYAASVKANLSQTISGVKQYIDIQNQIIKRGQ